MNYRILFSLLVLALWMTGCERPTLAPELSPAYAAAKKAAQRDDYSAAATAYRHLLDQYPQFQHGHLELALLYDEKLNDPIEAIHHYRRCLVLETNKDKRRIIEEYIARSRLKLAAKLPVPGRADTVELIRLQAENDALRAEIAALKNPPPPIVEPATNAVLPVIPEVIVPPVKPRTHIVVKGDTLTSLAAHYYGNRQAWVKIYEANRAALPNKDQLRLGQTLVIP